MKILLDECLPFGLRDCFTQREVHTVQWAGFKEKKNGELLKAAEEDGYGVFVTIDQGVPHQQNVAARQISVIILQARTNQIEDLLPLVDQISKAFETIQPGRTVVVSAA